MTFPPTFSASLGLLREFKTPPLSHALMALWNGWASGGRAKSSISIN